jgi:hypothetical protein
MTRGSEDGTGIISCQSGNTRSSIHRGCSAWVSMVLGPPDETGHPSYVLQAQPSPIKEASEYQGLWVYPVVMDVIALAAALGLGVATASMFSFSHEEVEVADQRYVAYYRDRDDSFLMKKNCHVSHLAWSHHLYYVGVNHK